MSVYEENKVVTTLFCYMVNLRIIALWKFNATGKRVAKDNELQQPESHKVQLTSPSCSVLKRCCKIICVICKFEA